MTTDYGAAPAPVPRSSKTNVLAIISLVAGIVALPLFCCWPISIPLGLVGIVLGAIALNQIKKTGEGGRGLALAGIITGALAIVLFVVLVVIGNVVDPQALQKQFGVPQAPNGDMMIEPEEMEPMDELGEPEPDAPGDQLGTDPAEPAEPEVVE